MSWSKQKISDFQQAILAWYAAHKKPLPWRETREPYKIWVSEIMSQQTQVETVIPYYARFMARFPDVVSLAKADEDEVLKLWEGLGYYSRARNLQAGARQVLSDYGSCFPSELTEIRKIKGIGPYTAAAIASICFNLPEPAVDGNLMRVSSRLFELSADVSKASDRKIFEQALRTIISPEEPGDFNQALMDLGATICTPKTPLCEICPVVAYCAAYAQGTQGQFPVKTGKIKQKAIYYLAFALQNSAGEWYLERRSATGLLANMWTFPMAEVPQNDYEFMLGGLAPIELAKNLPLSISRTAIVGEVTHVFSHLRWHVALVSCKIEEAFTVNEEKALLDNQKWASESDFINLAFPKPQRKMFDLLIENGYN